LEKTLSSHLMLIGIVRPIWDHPATTTTTTIYDYSQYDNSQKITPTHTHNFTNKTKSIT
jgi:hypothetical protein